MKLQALGPVTLLKRDSNTRVKFAKFLRIPILKNTFERLLLRLKKLRWELNLLLLHYFHSYIHKILFFFICNQFHFEFAKLRALRAFVPSHLTRLRALRALRAFVPYVPLRLTCLDFCAP